MERPRSIKYIIHLKFEMSNVFAAFIWRKIIRYFKAICGKNTNLSCVLQIVHYLDIKIPCIHACFLYV